MNTLYDYLRQDPIIRPAVATPKIIIANSAMDNILVISKKPTGGGVLTQLRSSVTLGATDSVNTAAELLRPTVVRNILDAVIYRTHDTLSNAGDWTTTTLSATNFGFPSGTTQTKQLGGSFTPITTTVNGAYADFICTAGPDGTVPFALRNDSTNNCDNVEFTEASTGRVLRTGVTTQRISVSGYTIVPVFVGLSEPTTIRVKHNGTAGTGLCILGAQWYRLGDTKANMDTAKYNGWMYWRDDNDYVTNTGAADYAMYELASGLWAGSYHGGQTRTYYLVRCGEKVVNSTDLIQIGTNVYVEQRTTISWATASGGLGQIKTYEELAFEADGTEYHEVTMAADVVPVLSFMYTLMSTTATSFTEVLKPFYIDLTTKGEYVALGNTGTVKQRNPLTGQTVTTISSPNPYTYIRQVYGEYNKAYGGPILGKQPGTGYPGGKAMSQMMWNQLRIFR